MFKTILLTLLLFFPSTSQDFFSLLPGTFEELLLYNTEGEESIETFFVSSEELTLTAYTADTFSDFDLDVLLVEDGALYPEAYTVSPVQDPSLEYDTIRAYTIENYELIPTSFQTVQETEGDPSNCEAMTVSNFEGYDKSQPQKNNTCGPSDIKGFGCAPSQTISSVYLVCQTVKECTFIHVPRIGPRCLCKSTTGCRPQPT